MTTPATFFDRLKSRYNNNPWRGRLVIVLLALLIFLGVVRLMLSQTIIYSTTYWLKKQGIEASIEAINFNIINGTVSLVNAKGFKDNKPLFNIGLVDIYWDWLPLSDKTIVITKVGLDNLSIHIKQYTDAIIIGGVTLPLSDAVIPDKQNKPAKNISTDKKNKHWAASLGEVIFTNLNICYLQHETTLQKASKDSLYLDYCSELKEISWAGKINYAIDKSRLNAVDIPLSSTGKFMLNNLSITDNKLNKQLLKSESNTLDHVIISGLNNIKIDQLEMNNLSLLQRKDKKYNDSIRFHQLSIKDINISNLNSIAMNDIHISKPGISLVKSNKTDWEYEQWVPKSSLPNKKIKLKDNAKTSPIFKLAFNNVSINKSDLCYQDKAATIDYCLSFAELTWNGVLEYSTATSKPDDINLLLKGDLKLTEQYIHNKIIDRNLLGISLLELSSLKISGNEEATLKKLRIKKLAALQRSKNKKDNTTSFDSLSINDLKYTPNKVAIDTVDLVGLANTISKNKNGKWEHNKWLTNKKADKSIQNKAEEKTTKSKPINIVLNRFNLTSDKSIIFTDNSTQPVMNIGLQNIKANLKDINSSKPDASTTFELFAKTIRHSTIDIKGTAKPFAEKVSFDAKGKLKGFDLRAASPATKKAIGHIIQSGQMDADLKLLAINGELDSDIKLSLYQFNIKSDSKEDAKKLDAKFGMPLNQTLTLLRDKDDSIHLDIPVTGNINNPNFEPMDAIIKATSKAATVTLITFYTPYGLIYAGGNLAFNLATALNFDPIDFNLGSTKLQDNNKKQLDELTKLMTEKPSVHLTLCGVTNQQDAIALFPDLKNKSKNKSENNTEEHNIKLTKKQAEKLKQLAKDRQVNTKNYLIKKGNIEHSRLILCTPEYNADAIAGVNIII